MSEQGWRDFLAADDVGDWAILHGGPTAVFKVGSLLESARLAAAVAEVPGLEQRDRGADRSGNKVCIAAWPDGAPGPEKGDDKQ